MDFRTEFKIKPFKHKITYNDKVLFIGSCFAENISGYFKTSGFQVEVNPFGILYHPKAIERSINIALDPNYNPEKFTFEHQGIWSNFDAHSSISATSNTALLENLIHSKRKTEQALKTSNFVFISLGTAWVYKHDKDDKIAANCHKLPQNLFSKQILDLETVKHSLENIINDIRSFNSKARIIFTLSPVRHLKDGFIENQISKSTLNLAIHEVINRHDCCDYFPSYELLLDDLRDYRFYDKDMVHPNAIALDYMWKKLTEVVFDNHTLSTLKKVNSINTRLEHRFFNPNSEASIRFKEKTEELIKSLQKSQPQIKF